ncbi:MAG: hypothetical protein ACSHXJ_17590 [Marinomonas colpomeniae]
MFFRNDYAFFSVAIYLFSLLLSSPIFSVEPRFDSEIELGSNIMDSKDTTVDLDNNDFFWWQHTHQSVSEIIGSWSNNMDTFLSGKPSLGKSDSQVEIRFGPILDKDATTGFFEFHAQLKLPNTKDRLRLVIESDGDSITPENVRNEATENSSVINSALESNFSAAVRYIKSDLGADIDVGVLVDFPLNPFLRLRFRQHDREGSWTWHQKQEAFAYYSEGLGVRYGLGVNHQFSSSLNYGSDFSIVWLDNKGLFYARENFFIHHYVNSKNKLSYQLSFLQSGEDELIPDSFLYNLQYERFLHEDWLIGQVKPQFTHEAEENYSGNFSLTLSLVILFGPKYVH